MKIVIFAFIMVVALTLVDGWWANRVPKKRYGETDTVDGMRLKRDLNNKLVQLDLGNGQRRYI
jgi:FtsZ-interacting cell division protein ZipA